MIIAVLVTAIVSFSVGNCLNGWGYRHRDEEAEEHPWKYQPVADAIMEIFQVVCIIGLLSVNFFKCLES